MRIYLVNFMNLTDENVILGKLTHAKEVFEYIINKYLVKICNTYIIKTIKTIGSLDRL